MLLKGSCRWAGFVSSSLLAAVLVAGTAQATEGVQPPVDRLIVKFKPLPATVVPKARVAMANAVLSASNTGVPMQALRQTATGAQVVSLGEMQSLKGAYKLVSQLMGDPAVEYAEPDLLMRPMAVPNDPRYNEQWHYYEPAGGLNLPEAWDVTQGEGVVVAVLDTGYRPHADLVDNIVPGYDFVSDSFMGNDGDGRDSDPSDPGDAMTQGECGLGFPEADMPSSWHGTHVAGTIAAVTNNGIGVAGVAPKAKVQPLRVLGKCGGYTSDITDAMLWAVGVNVDGVPPNPTPAKVVNLSLGSPVPASCTQTYSTVINTIVAAGATVVIASGNENGNADTFPPGNCPQALTVAAVNRSGGRAYYSNFGSLVDIAAPGGAQFYANDPNAILSTGNAGTEGPGADNYLFYQGTSMATPHVAGLAALLYAAGATDQAQVETVIKQGAREFPATCNGCGVGIADAATAVGILTGTIDPAEQTNLSLTLKGDNGKFKPFVEGEPLGYIQYIAKVVNQGPLEATNVVLENGFPEQVSLATITPSKGSCSSDGLSCSLGTLAVDEEVTVTINVTTENDKKMQFTAEVRSDYLDSDTTDNFVIKRYGGSLEVLLLLSMAGLALRRKA